MYLKVVISLQNCGRFTRTSSEQKLASVGEGTDILLTIFYSPVVNELLFKKDANLGLLASLIRLDKTGSGRRFSENGQPVLFPDRGSCLWAFTS